jgi:FecR protein
MRNDYLWDGSGEPDPELQKLEAALGQFRTKAEAPAFAADVTAANGHGKKDFSFARRMPRFFATALLGAATAAAAVMLFVHVAPVANGPGWDVARLEGAPVVGMETVEKTAARAKLRVGELLVTDGASRASVQVGGIGELYVDPGSRVRLVESGSNRKRIMVELGTIHAAIWAPPGEFVVDTPSATAVDLGCAYTLKVAEDGSGTLQTTLGWVGFHTNGRDAFIPAGAMCLTRRKEGLGTPFFEDASEEFRGALHAMDFEGVSGTKREKALRTVLAEARLDDGFTLWHLLARVSDHERPRVYDRLAELVRAPKGTTREGTLRLEPKMMDLWWNAFHLGDIEIWRFWERNEAPMVKKAAG